MHSYINFFNALPTVLIPLFIFSLLYKKSRCHETWYIIGTGSIMIPLAYGITLIPVSIKYMNISFLLFLVFVIYLFDKLLLSRKLRWFLASGAVLLTFFEVIPFQPIHGSFRPVWANYSDAFNKYPGIGKMHSSAWAGWGEEVMIAGKRIEKMCIEEKLDCNDVRLYYSYRGGWLDAEIPVKTFWMLRDFPFFRFTENDYYIINRASVMYGHIRDIDFKSVKPFFTIDYRGYTQAWVFRGDELIKPEQGPVKLFLNNFDKSIEIRDKELNKYFFGIISPYVD
jgi:hypothetical protein